MNKKNDESTYVNFEKYKTNQQGLIKKKDIINFFKDSIYIEMLNGNLEIVYNLDNPDEMDYIELKAEIKCRKKTEDMKVDKLDLIYKKLIELDSSFNSFKTETTEKLSNIESDIINIKSDIVNIKSDIVKIKECPTIQKEIKK